MAPRKTSKSASKDVESAMRKRKEGTLRSGRSGRKVTSKKQAIAIGLSEARKRVKRSGRKNSLSNMLTLSGDISGPLGGEARRARLVIVTLRQKTREPKG